MVGYTSIPDALRVVLAVLNECLDGMLMLHF